MDKYYAHQESEVPELPGIYAFYYAPFQASRLGLYLDNKNIDILSLKEKVRKRITCYHFFKEWSSIEVNAIKRNASGLNVGAYDGRLNSKDAFLDIVDSLNDNNIHKYISFFQNASFFFQPLYCGVTVEQGLQARLYQHKKNYHANTNGTFGARLKEAGIQWEDVCFVTAGSFNFNANKNDVYNLERFLISNSTPTFNIK